MGIVTTLLTLAIFSMNTFELGEVFYRILSAAAIIDITMTITVSIMHRLLLQKHPEFATQSDQANAQPTKSFWRNPLIVIFLIFVAVPVVSSLIALSAFLTR